MSRVLQHHERLMHDPFLKDMVHRLTDAFHPQRIYLFGSHARGEAGPDSDYDLLMIVTHSALPRYRREQEAFRALAGVGTAKDILVMTREEFDRTRCVVSSLPAAVEREGILLYAA